MHRPRRALSMIVAALFVSFGVFAQVPPTDPNAPSPPQPFPTPQAPGRAASDLPSTSDRSAGEQKQPHRDSRGKPHKSPGGVEPKAPRPPDADTGNQDTTPPH